MAQLNVAARIFQPEGIGLILGLRLLVEDLKNALGAGHRGLEVVIDIRDLHKGARELPHIQQKAGDEADVGNFAGHEQNAAAHRDGEIAQIVDDIHQRHQIARPDQGLDRHPAQRGVLFLKLPLHERFPAEGFDHGKPGNALLHLAVQNAQILLLRGKELPGVLCDDFRQQEDERYPDEGDQRQDRAEADHHDEDADNGKAIGQQQGQRV